MRVARGKVLDPPAFRDASVRMWSAVCENGLFLRGFFGPNL